MCLLSTLTNVTVSSPAMNQKKKKIVREIELSFSAFHQDPGDFTHLCLLELALLILGLILSSYY